MHCNLKEEFKEKQKHWIKKLKEYEKNRKKNEDFDSDNDSNNISLVKSECKLIEKSKIVIEE